MSIRQYLIGGPRAASSSSSSSRPEPRAPSSSSRGGAESPEDGTVATEGSSSVPASTAKASYPATSLPSVTSVEPAPKRARGFRTEHRDWLEEVSEGFYCRICRPAFLRGDSAARTGEMKSFIGRLVGPKDQPGRKADAHTREAIHVALSARMNSDAGRGQHRNALAVMYQASTQSKAQQLEKEKVGVRKYIEVLYFLTKEEIPHTTKYPKLLDLVYRFDPKLASFAATRPGNATYRSSNSSASMIASMDSVLDDKVVHAIRESINEFGVFSVLADETTAYGESVLSIYVRYLVVCEDSSTRAVVATEELLHVEAISDTKAETIYHAIDKAVEDRQLDKGAVYSVSFDGASCMASAKDGVYGLIRSRLQLVARSVAKAAHPLVQQCMDYTQQLYTAFSRSNRKSNILKASSTKLRARGDRYKGLLEVAPTRWLSTSNAIDRVLVILPIVIDALSAICGCRDFPAEERRKCRGIGKFFCKSYNIKLLIILRDILGAMARLSECFQSVGLAYVTAVEKTSDLLKFLEALNHSDSLDEAVCKDSAEIERQLAELDVDEFRSLPRSSHVQDSLFDVMSPFIKDLISEVKARFRDDVLYLATLGRFDRPEWNEATAQLVSIKLEGVACTWKEAIRQEVPFLKRDLEHTPLPNDGDFHGHFLSNSRLVSLYPNHAKICAVVMCLPTSTATVERCFSTTTRLADDHRPMSGVTLTRLMRINEQGPAVPRLGEGSRISDSYDNFIEAVWSHWRDAESRRIDCSNE
ncbi:hypothetical protein FOZ63_030864 [Perkinsus olseni]|uniref:HAT C-terminal dimerisation domain-containing protein n=1 Tax=Perkinsus olseni TaxID=32597 RepID=A0A7J6UP90_PEROL|nr:hypothetical protein FOZ63_030864 [Perkinsus olseni]